MRLVGFAWPLLTAVLVGCGAKAPLRAAALAPEVGPSPLELPPDRAEPPARAGAVPLEGSLATGDERPVAQVLRFDVDALPVATWGEAWPAAGFTVHKLGEGVWKLWVQTTIHAEVIVTAAPRSNGNGTAPVGFAAFTGGSFGEGAVPACGRAEDPGKRLAVWDGFSPAGWTDDGMDVEMEEGDFDLSTCHATPVHSLRGRAAALVPGYVYALRVRDEGDDDDVHESVVLFLPGGQLVSTASDPETALAAAHVGPFTRLTLPLEPGTAGSATLRLTPVLLGTWATLRRTGSVRAQAEGTPLAEDLLFGVDVSWQGSARLGSLSFAPPKAKNRKAYAALLAAVKKRAM